MTSTSASILKGLHKNAERSGSYCFNEPSATPLVITIGTLLYPGIVRMAFAISIPSIIGII